MVLDNLKTLPHRDVLIPDLDVGNGLFYVFTISQVIRLLGWNSNTNSILAMYLLCPTPPAHVTILADLRSVEIFAPCSLVSWHLAVIQQAENVSHNLGVHVLRHASMKPSRRTMGAIQRYFTSVPSSISDPGQLIVIGDRVFTDVVIANRLGAYSILVSRDWSPTIRSRAGVAVERVAARLARRLTHTPQTPSSNPEFVKDVRERKDEVKLNYSGSTWTWVGRALGIGPNSGKHR